MKMLPSPEENNQGAKSKSSSHRQGGQGFKVPSIDEIAGMLMKLNGLVLLRVITTAQAAVMQRSLQTLLNIQTNRASAEREGLSQETLEEIFRRDPTIVNLLEPFLSEDQVNWFMGAGEEDPDGQD